MKALIRKVLWWLLLPRRTAYLSGLIAAQEAWGIGPEAAALLWHHTHDPFLPGDFDRGCQDGLTHLMKTQCKPVTAEEVDRG